MLTARATGAVDRSVRIDVSTMVVQFALTHVVGEAALRRCSCRLGCGCFRVSDRAEPPVCIDVLVVRDTAASCQHGTQSVVQGHARSVLMWDEPDALPATLAALGEGRAVIPSRAISLALEAPPLTARLRLTLGHLAAGRSSRVIAELVRQSESTVKRDIAELLALFDAPNRASLVASALRLGFLSRVGERSETPLALSRVAPFADASARNPTSHLG